MVSELKIFKFMTTIERTHKDIIQGTKKHIIEVARQLFSKYSYLGVSMSDIAKKLNITKAALYYHFTGKTEIYKKVLDKVFNNLEECIKKALKEKSDRKKLYLFIKNYLDFGFEEKNFIKTIALKLPFADTKIKKYILDLKQKHINLLASLIKNITKKKKGQSEMMAFLLIEMMNGLILEQSYRDKRFDSKKLGADIISCFVLN